MRENAPALCRCVDFLDKKKAIVSFSSHLIDTLSLITYCFN
ncbi:hypothetical protein HMPREF1621_01960 [Escherichia coli A25922R]|nr:hypothetical protein HMPREF1603_01125 [Escherichia coli 907892]ESE34950.1 hypothetical protein HMPREF1621_01960 [Escherichia coli A25922R]KXG99165.1 hypothetical protein HMPREF3041_00988 [Escherichia coli]